MKIEYANPNLEIKRIDRQMNGELKETGTVAEVFPLQDILFNKISRKLSSPKNLPAALAEVLGISTFSAYRRLRRDVALSMDEMETLIEHYNIDLFNNVELPWNYNFIGGDLSKPVFDFLEGQKNLVKEYGVCQEEGDAYFIHSGIDITPVAIHSSPLLLTFSDFFWKNCFLNTNSKREELFCSRHIADEVKTIADQYFDIHQATRSTEIWSVLCLETFLHQIEYMRDMQFFAEDKDRDVVYDELEAILSFNEKQAQVGFKLNRQGDILESQIAYELYITDLFFSDSTAYIYTKKREYAILKHNLQYIYTGHKLFVENAKNTLNIILSKAKPISATNERGRKLFFNGLRQRVKQSRGA